MTMETGVTTDTSTSEQRWAAWVARGVAQDKKRNKVAMAVPIVIAAAFALWIALFFTMG